jgi:hypothetical protein
MQTHAFVRPVTLLTVPVLDTLGVLACTSDPSMDDGAGGR